tara:strand:- start:588 stop:1145 length:558 start_codon:yes stop_codon:yes gene_type:complete
MAKINPRCMVSSEGLEYVIRNPIIEDAKGILALANSVSKESEFQVSEPDEFKMTISEEKKWIERMNVSEWNLVLVAEFQGKIIGLLDFHCNSKQRRLSHTGGFGISVLKEHRNQKIGSMLIETLLEWARGVRQIEKVTLAVLASNDRAIYLYKKLGFLEEGRRIKAIKLGPDQYVDDILMARFLD